MKINTIEDLKKVIHENFKVYTITSCKKGDIKYDYEDVLGSGMFLCCWEGDDYTLNKVTYYQMLDECSESETEYIVLTIDNKEYEDKDSNEFKDWLNANTRIAYEDDIEGTQGQTTFYINILDLK